MGIQDYTKPDFLLCEIPIKDGSFHDQRTWVYALNALSLIEFLHIDHFEDFELDKKSSLFIHAMNDQEDEHWVGIFTQDNCGILGLNPTEVMNAAWIFFRGYLAWEDDNIDKDDRSRIN